VPRYVDVFEDRVRILFAGLDSLAVFRSELSLSYSMIDQVEVGLSDVPHSWSWRLGIAFPFSDRRQGRFWTGGEKLFLDIRERTRAVVLYLKPGSEFSVVAFDDPRPEQLAESIRQRLKSRRS
jgi:hypothetical protein